MITVKIDNGIIGTITAAPGDEITWDAAEGEDKHRISIWVPDERVFGKRLIAEAALQPVDSAVATIRKSVPKGLDKDHRAVYEYIIYDHDTGKFVVGKSHPKIEIPGP